MHLYPISALAPVRCVYQRIAPNSIVWLEGEINYTHLHRVGQQKQLSARTLKWFALQLPGFVRVRRDALVNPGHIRAISRRDDRPDRLRLLLSDGTCLDVARRRTETVRNQLRQLAVTQ